MRGTDVFNGPPLLKGGIIPAHAGNSCSEGSATNRRRDHPRTCGEQSSSSIWHRNRRGSSPHMRGTAPGSTTQSNSSGIIPAHAGNRYRSGGLGTASRDHPRTCGEQDVEAIKSVIQKGSSPHMRGTGVELQE